MQAQLATADSSAGEQQPQYETHLARLAQTPGRPTNIMRPVGRLPYSEECKHYYSSYEMPEVLQKWVHQRSPILSLTSTHENGKTNDGISDIGTKGTTYGKDMMMEYA